MTGSVGREGFVYFTVGCVTVISRSMEMKGELNEGK
jgi:hypothetical protein